MFFPLQLSRLALIGILALLPATLALAETDHQAAIKQIKARLAEVLQIKEIIPVADTGFYRLILADEFIVFTDEKANGFVVGDVYSYEDGKFINQSEIILNRERLAAVTKLASKDMVIFPAKGKKIGQMYVFTDIDCGYCRRLHEEINNYQNSGVEVLYIAWPRCGTTAKCPTYKKMVNVWCAANQQQAMTNAKRGIRVKDAKCSNPIAEQFVLGQRLGLRGTPFIILSNGTVIPGYKSASEIVSLF